MVLIYNESIFCDKLQTSFGLNKTLFQIIMFIGYECWNKDECKTPLATGFWFLFFTLILFTGNYILSRIEYGRMSHRAIVQNEDIFLMSEKGIAARYMEYAEN